MAIVSAYQKCKMKEETAAAEPSTSKPVVEEPVEEKAVESKAEKLEEECVVQNFRLAAGLLNMYRCSAPDRLYDKVETPGATQKPVLLSYP